MIRKQNINLKEYKIIKRKKSLWNSIFNRKNKKKFTMKVIFKNFLLEYNKINEALIEKIKYIKN